MRGQFSIAIVGLLFFGSVAGATTHDWTNSPSTGYEAGDTVRLWGTFTNALVLTNSGTAESPITFEFQSGAKFTAATWTTNIISLNGKSHLVLQGGTLEATDNGTSRTYQNTFAAIGGRFGYATNVVIRDMAISDLYVRTGTTDTTIACVGIECWDISGLVITNCSFTNMYAWFWIKANTVGVTNLQILGCQFLKSRGSVLSVSSAHPIRDVVIDGNHFDDMQPWYDDGNQFHCEYIQMYAQPAGAGPISEVYIRNNDFGILTGAGTHSHSTAFLYFTECLDNFYIYNNLFVAREGTENCSNAMLSIVASSLTDMDVVIAHNTFAGSSNGYGRAMQLQATSPSTITVTVSNNIVAGLASAYYTSGGGQTTYRDRNLFYGNVSQTENEIQAWGGGGDTNSIFGDDPLLNTDCTLQSGSPAIGAGAVLGGIFDLDKNGVSRGATVDLGAYEYAAESPAVTNRFYGTLTIHGTVQIRE